MPPRPRRRPASPLARAARARAATGRRGEELAADHLRRLGFTILDRNVRTRYGEIDLVACDPLVLAFVEVKTTRAGTLAPLERVGRGQRARLRRLALSWMIGRPPGSFRRAQVRFDAIGVVLDRDGSLLALEHVEGAW